MNNTKLVALFALAMAVMLASCSPPSDDDGGGNGVVPAEIAVERASTNINDSDTDDLGDVVYGVAQLFDYEVFNDGGADLDLTGSPRVEISAQVNCAASVSVQPVATIVGGDSDTFTISLTVTAAGAFSFDVTIENNDSDEGNFTFTVDGMGVGAPEIDVQRPAATSIANGATDTLGSSFTVGANPAITWTIANTGTDVLTLSGAPAVATSNTVNCSVVLSVAPSGTVAAAGSTTFDLTITTTASGAFSFDFTIANDDSDEGSYVVHCSGTCSASPAMTVYTDHSAVTSAGTVKLARLGQEATAVVPVFIRNSGGATLNVTSVVISSPTNCTASVRDAAPATVAANTTAYCTVIMTATTSGNPSCVVTINSDDPTNPAFAFTLQSTLVTSNSVIYSTGTANGYDLRAGTFPGAPTVTVISDALVPGGASGVTEYHHLIDRTVYVANLDIAGATDIYFRGIPPQTPGTPTKVTTGLTGTTGYAGSIKFLQGDGSHNDSFAFVANAGGGAATKLYVEGVNGTTLTGPTEISGTLPSGSPGGVQNYWVSPRGDSIVFMGDFTTAGTNELYHVSVAGGTVTKVSAALTAGRRVASNTVQWLGDNSGIIYEAESNSSDQREIYYARISPTFNTVKINGTVPAAHIGVKYNQVRLAASGTRVFYPSDEAGTNGQYELYAANITGGTVSAPFALNGGTPPGNTNYIANYAVNNVGSKVLFVADSGPLNTNVFSNQYELYYSTISGTTPTTNKIITSSITNGTGVLMYPTRTLFNDNKAYVTDDPNSANRQELFFIDLSLASPTATLVPGMGAFPGGSSGVDIATVKLLPDGSKMLFVSPQGGAGGGAVLYIANFSTSPSTAQLSSNASQHSAGQVTVLGNRVWFSETDGSTVTPLKTMLITDGAGTEVNNSGTEISSAMGFPQQILPFNTDRVIYYYGTIGYPGVASANCAGAITQQVIQAGGAASSPNFPVKVGTETLP